MSIAKDFWGACAAPGPLRLGVRWSGTPGAVYREIERPFALIGADLTNDLSLGHEQVSQRHAYLQVVGGQVFCTDLQGRSGIRWSDGATGSGWLAPGRVMRLGPFRVWLLKSGGEAEQQGDAPPSPLQAPPAQDDPLPAVVLEPLAGGPPPPYQRVAAPLTVIGTADGCGVRLTDQGVSRFHCGLLRTPAGPWVIDLHRGTRVNGGYVEFAWLRDGDLLEVGAYTARVRCEEAPAGAPLARAARPAGGLVQSPGRSRSAPARVLPRVLLEVSPPYPAAPHLPGGVRGPQAGEAWLLHLVSQMAAAHQQVSDQCRQAWLAHQQTTVQHQQTMAAMLHLLGAAPPDRVGLVRDELARLREVTRDLQALHAELVEHAPSRSGAAPAPPVPPAHRPSVGRDEAAGQQVPSDRRTEGATVPAPPTAATADTDPGAARNPELGAPPRSGGTGADAYTPPSHGEENPHAVLARRMISLEEEQRTLWQKVVTFLSGNGGRT